LSAGVFCAAFSLRRFTPDDEYDGFTSHAIFPIRCYSRTYSNADVDAPDDPEDLMMCSVNDLHVHDSILREVYRCASAQ
jgi:hypothetical protein